MDEKSIHALLDKLEDKSSPFEDGELQESYTSLDLEHYFIFTRDGKEGRCPPL